MFELSTMYVKVSESNILLRFNLLLWWLCWGTIDAWLNIVLWTNSSISFAFSFVALHTYPLPYVAGYHCFLINSIAMPAPRWIACPRIVYRFRQWNQPNMPEIAQESRSISVRAPYCEMYANGNSFMNIKWLRFQPMWPGCLSALANNHRYDTVSGKLHTCTPRARGRIDYIKQCEQPQMVVTSSL